MRRIFTYTYSWITIIAMAIFMNCALAYSAQTSARDTTNYFLSKRKPKKNLLSFTLPPIKPGVISSTHVVVPHADDKLLSNVEVYPNPITDQINLKYSVSRNSNVTIKIVDVLGNDVMTLFSSSRVEPGEQTVTRSLNNKLNRGFYFVKIVAGTESVIKRISIL
jgi:hypothetical protein